MKHANTILYTFLSNSRIDGDGEPGVSWKDFQVEINMIRGIRRVSGIKGETDDHA
jgi:hypothetical protein